MPPRRSSRRHALLPSEKGPAGEPFLPFVGELYLLETIICSLGHDPAADRRAVVVTVPRSGLSWAPVQVVTRTTQEVPGVRHPADESIGCDRDGCFAHLANVEQQLWRPDNVVLLGRLPDPFLTAVLERWA